MGIRIHSLKEIEKLIKDPAAIQFYRGESKLFKKPLTCGICRTNDDVQKIKKKEKFIFDEFVREIVNKEKTIQNIIPSKYDFEKEWFYLFQGQHLGLKTRLIDWTTDWKIALLFSVNEWKNDTMDGHFWIFNCPEEIKINLSSVEIIFNTNFFDVGANYMINPSQYYNELDESDYIGRRRMSRQYAHFLIQSLNDSLTPLCEQNKFKQRLTHLIIDSKFKTKIRNELIEEGCYLSDWIYYKNDCSISSQIRLINDKYNV